MVRWGILIISLIYYTISYTSQEVDLLVYIIILPAYIPLQLTPVNWVTTTSSGGISLDIIISSVICYISSYTSQEADFLDHINSIRTYITLYLAPVKWGIKNSSGRFR